MLRLFHERLPPACSFRPPGVARGKPGDKPGGMPPFGSRNHEGLRLNGADKFVLCWWSQDKISLESRQFERMVYGSVDTVLSIAGLQKLYLGNHTRGGTSFLNLKMLKC